ncbi:FAD-binding oxidoreductase [Mesorhizobium sp.]|uniref:NAD(P)/FAD-dependent oxidoreductase n=1 Tax=Mesorhizobium sp. TaxID=1871066 RepID=UPI000FE71C77|nr:FAD-binding oxidoreductase [Mesorhizobium sp.]RWB02158.1 MAG: FAD-binding oxidoreductase [Mesorhizobium sp.]
MSAAKHVIVVGAGIIGASIAWHLAKAGANVTIVADSGAGGVATPNSFAWINASWGNPEPYFRLRTRSMAEWTRLAHDVPGIPLAWCGLCWDLPPAELEAYAAEHSAWGYGIERVDRVGAARIEPNLTELPDFALHVAGEGVAEPVAATQTLLADAERLGARVITGTTVTALIQTNGRISGVDTSGGRIVADEVVIAAGAGSAAIAATAGLKLPIETPPGLIVHSRPYEKLLNGLVIGDRLHMRQTAEGRIIAGSDFGGADLGMDAEATALELYASMKTMLRGADRLELDFHTVGYRPTPIDGFPIIGRAQGVSGLYVAVMHSGITLAPAVGLFAGREILDDARDPLLEPYGLARFAQ